MHRVAALAIVVLVGLFMSGCGLTVPADPGGSMDRIEGGTLRAGASLDPGLVSLTDGEVTGPLVDLIEQFAAAHGAEVEWTVDSEESLVGALEDDQMDVAVGGMTSETPWIDRAGVSRGYPTIPGAGGRELVVLVPLGENRLLFELESFLDQAVLP